MDCYITEKRKTEGGFGVTVAQRNDSQKSEHC